MKLVTKSIATHWIAESKMIRPDWKKFASKFSDNPQYNFEWLCYRLFCKQFDKPYGVFRYKNQSALETNAIEVDGKFIGFQAKFYDTVLSKHHDEIIECLETARRDYADLTTLHFYSNNDWTQAFPGEKGNVKATPTAAETAIKNKAKELGIEIVWCLPSYFDSSFVVETCQNICRMFFLENGSVLDFVDQQKKHTVNILDQIHSQLEFKDKKIQIERDNILAQLKAEKSKISIISGPGGVGKTLEIKKLYSDIHTYIPLFVFKATEFELRSLADFSRIADINEFAEAFSDSERKIIVIDSAEKLLDLSNLDPSKEFIEVLLKNNWQLIFTTRDHYFNDLNFQCINVYREEPKKIHINILTSEYLNELSEINGFKLPSDKKLSELLRIPLYLREYLQAIDDNSALHYLDFKNRLWDTKIKQSSIKREQVFLSLAVKRANHGSFFLQPETAELDIAEELARDGLLSDESSSFFITHDIYEEWALERFINSAFVRKQSKEAFFEEIGQSLPIRRSFRNWVSEKLLLDDQHTKRFLNEILEDADLALFWKDEILVSILLSDYSAPFFDIYKDKLLENDMELTKRICFLLRIACKDVDETMFKQLNIKSEKSFNYIFTKPKGRGWDETIKLLFENLNVIDAKKRKFITPLIKEWSSSVKVGETTRLAGLIALHIYKAKESYYSSGHNDDNPLLITISNSTSEIKAELHELLLDIVANSYSDHRDPYFDLSEYILTSMNSLLISKTLPHDVLKIAKLFWLKSYDNDDNYYLDHQLIQYGLTNSYEFKYFPESAYQTPIYFLIGADFTSTLNFIISFINEVVYNRNQHSDDQIFINLKIKYDGFETEIYDDFDVWSSYRGGNHSPALFTSILMALEKTLLEISIQWNGSDLERLLLHILNQSKSCAIYGLVTSIVLAHPEKTYRVAKILFTIKEAILADKQRLLLDTQYDFNRNLVNQMTGGITNNKFLEDERLEASKATHRFYSLEELFLRYQIFRTADLTDEDFAARQRELWLILDDHLDKITDNYSEESMVWRLALARMDRRKNEIKTEVIDDKVAVSFVPSIDEDLKSFSEQSLERINSPYKYASLKNWAYCKLSGNDNYKQYEDYERSPSDAFKKLDELVEESQALVKSGGDLESFRLHNRGTPCFVCAVLLKHHRGELSDGQIKSCVEVLLNFSERILTHEYTFQLGDGMDACFMLLHELFTFDEEAKLRVTAIVLASLLRNDSMDMWGSEKFSRLGINAICRLGEKYQADAEALLFGYIKLAKKYSEMVDKQYQSGMHRLPRNKKSLLQDLFINNSAVLQDVYSNAIKINATDDLINLGLVEKVIALDIISHCLIAGGDDLFFTLAESSIHDLASEDRNNRDYHSKNSFLKTYTRYVLLSKESDIPKLMAPFILNFQSYELITILMKEFLTAQDGLSTHDNFWAVWNIFKPKVVAMGNTGWFRHDETKVIRAYLFVNGWKDAVEEWNTFQPKDERFFREVSRELASCPSTLFSIAKLLNDVGYCYRNEGIAWLSTILETNAELFSGDLETDTVYYVERYIKRYLHENSQVVRKNLEVKNNVLVILNFLVERGEVSGYLLKETII
jgi:hypothetical protein